MLATCAPSGPGKDLFLSGVVGQKHVASSTVKTSSIFFNDMSSGRVKDTIAEPGIESMFDIETLVDSADIGSDNNELAIEAKSNEVSPLFENLTQSLGESAAHFRHVIPSDVSFADDALKPPKIHNMEEEERRLVLASVKHVDCQDFPFDEVLSLENTVQQVSYTLQPGEMRHCSSKRIRFVGSKQNRSPVSQEMYIESKSKSVGKKNRPPLLKCSTWPKSECLDVNSIDKSADDLIQTNTAEVSVSSTKLDSPSFYSSTAIDFSAISHLSEEHDKLMAQENAKKSSKNSFISNSTKEKLYGKATQRSMSVGGKSRRDSYKNKNKDSSYSVTSMSFNGTMTAQPGPVLTALQPVTDGPKNSVSVSRKSDQTSRKAPKTGISTLEKAFRKRYTSSSGITVTSTPFPSLQRENSGHADVAAAAQSLSTAENLLAGESLEASKKHLHLPAEKQPLPPEGFKISRYPLKKSPAVSVSSPSDVFDQGSAGDSDLLRIIGELRKQLERAEEKISEVEKQAREWRETAQQTLRAAQVIKSQMEIEKARATRAESRVSGDGNLSSHNAMYAEKVMIPRRWSNDGSSTKKESPGFPRPRVVSADSVVSKPNCQTSLKAKAASGRKRRSSRENSHSKRPRSDPSCGTGAKPVPASDVRSTSLLAWLSNTGSDEEIDYMTFLETNSLDQHVLQQPTQKTNANQRETPTQMSSPVARNVTSNQASLTQRSMSHDEVRRALRAKVGGTKQDSPGDVVASHVPNFPPKLPLKVQNSLDRFLEGLTAAAIEVESSDSANVPLAGKTADSLLLLPPYNGSVSPISFGISHSLSDSELNNCDPRKPTCASSTQGKTFLARRMSNSESDLTKTFANDATSQETDFLNQLDRILDL